MYSINYGVEDSEDYLSSTHLTSDECWDLTMKTFYPLIFNENNAPKTYEEIKHNFSLLHFVTHCYGASALNQIAEYAAELLSSLEYNEPQLQDLLGNIISINFAPMRKPIFLSNINIMSLKDDIINHDSYKAICTNPITINKNENNLNIISQRIVTEKMARSYISDHDIKSLYRNKEWQLRFKATKDDENLQIYSGENAECLSEIASHILAENIAISLRREYGEHISKPTISDMENLASNILSHYSQDELIP